MKEATLQQISWELARKRRLLRELLWERHISSYTFVNVRMSNVYDFSWRLGMAVKKANGKTKEKAEFKGFFNLEMTVEQKADCKAWVRQDELVAVEIEDALASGYKISLSRDARSDGYQASMQCNDAESVNAGYCMSAYAKHWYDALGVLMFKHNILLKRVWEKTEEVFGKEDFG